MTDYADHWHGLIEGAIGYIAPDSINGKKIKPVLEQIVSEARAISDRHFRQAMENGAAANALRQVNTLLLAKVAFYAGSCEHCAGAGHFIASVGEGADRPCEWCADLRALIDLATKEPK